MPQRDADRDLRARRQLPSQHRPGRRDPRHLAGRRRHRCSHRPTTPVATFVLPADGSFGPVELESGSPLRIRPHGAGLADPAPSLSAAVLPQQRLRAPAVVPSQTARPASTPTPATTIRRSSPCGCASGTPSTTPTSTATRRDSLLDQHRRRQRRSTRWPSSSATRRSASTSTTTRRRPASSSLAALPYFSEQPFQSGVDVFMPSTADGSRHDHRSTNVPRGDTARPQTLQRAQLAVEHARHQRRVHRLPGRLSPAPVDAGRSLRSRSCSRSPVPRSPR